MCVCVLTERKRAGKRKREKTREGDRERENETERESGRERERERESAREREREKVREREREREKDVCLHTYVGAEVHISKYVYIRIPTYTWRCLTRC